MHPRAQEFASEARERYGLDVDVHEFPEGTKTAADAAEAIACDVSQIGSSLVFVASGGDDVETWPVIVVTSGANRVNEKRLARHVGADRVRMAEADEVRDATGWSIGGVPPFGHESELQVLLDDTLTEHETIWVAAGTPEAVFPIDPVELIDLADAEVVDVAE